MDGKRDMSEMQKAEVIAKVKEVGGEGSRVLEFIASTETPDRSNDIIDVNGWVLDSYMGAIGKGSNPIFAWAHNYSKPPVGKTVAVNKDTRGKALVIRVKFPAIAEMCSDPAHPSEEALFSDTVYNMYKNGMLSAVSVGFRAIKYKTRDDAEVLEKPEWMRGTHFLEVELLEVSAVLVPCNQDALVTMRGIKSFSPDGIAVMEKMLAEKATTQVEEDMDAKTLAELDARVKALEDGAAVTKAGSKFSKESREAIGKVAEALKACHKGIKACHETLAKLIEEPPAEAQSGTEDQDDGASDGVEKPTPNTDDGKAVAAVAIKQLDLANASLDDIAKLL